MSAIFPKKIVGAALLDRSTPRIGASYDAVILRGETEASSSYVLRVGQEVIVSSDDPDDPYIARVVKLVYSPGDSPPWVFTCRWYYKIKETGVDSMKKHIAKVWLIVRVATGMTCVQEATVQPILVATVPTFIFSIQRTPYFSQGACSIFE